MFVWPDAYTPIFKVLNTHSRNSSWFVFFFGSKDQWPSYSALTIEGVVQKKLHRFSTLVCLSYLYWTRAITDRDVDPKHKSSKAIIDSGVSSVVSTNIIRISEPGNATMLLCGGCSDFSLRKGNGNQTIIMANR